MTTNLTSYSPLESFLLFQYLSSYGVDHASFDRVSGLLQSNPLIKNAATFDTGRLSADALRDLYSRLLKEEIQSDLQHPSANENDSLRPDGPSPSRKRKAPSPSLPSAQEASQAAHLIPQLITKLYTRYRQYAIREIRDQERAYTRLQKELQEIQKGEWDERLRREIEEGEWKGFLGREGVVNGIKPVENGHSPAPTGAKTGPKAPSETPKAGLGPDISKDVQEQPFTVPGLSPGPQTAPLKQPPTEKPSDVRPQAGQPGQIPSINAPSPTITDVHRPEEATPTQPSPSTTPSLPHQQPPTSGTVPEYAQNPTTGGSPALVSQLPRTPAGVAPSPPSRSTAQTSPGPSPDPAKITAYMGSGTPPIPQPSARPPVSPEYAVSPAQKAAPIHPNAWPQQPPPNPQKSPQTVPYVSNYQHNLQGGYMLPPFQVNLGAGTQPQSQQVPGAPVGPPGATSPPNQAPVPQVTKPPTPVATPIVPPQLSNTIIGWLRDTPPSRIMKAAKTAQTVNGLPAGSTDAHMPKRPRHMSPISERAPSPPPRSRRGKPTRTQPTPKQTEDQKAVFTEPEPRQTRRTMGRPRRRGSAASSAVGSSLRGRTRSQSIVSQADDISIDAESSFGRPIKPEPSTPAEVSEDIRSTIEHTPTTGISTRRRRGTLATTQRPAPPKRKRSVRSTSEATDARRSSTPTAAPGTGVRPQFVLATRNFSRVSNPVMQTITSHKHASLFAHPVKAKDAEGYYDMIHRPTDLKSIRAAITAGARTVAAAASSQADSGIGAAASPGTPAAAGSGSASVVLPLSAEVVPPKAIVNSAQLERELVRMLVNAVMFNPGEEGVVQDAREMFESVETEVSNWRAAERGGEGSGG